MPCQSLDCRNPAGRLLDLSRFGGIAGKTDHRQDLHGHTKRPPGECPTTGSMIGRDRS